MSWLHRKWTDWQWKRAQAKWEKEALVEYRRWMRIYAEVGGPVALEILKRVRENYANTRNLGPNRDLHIF